MTPIPKALLAKFATYSTPPESRPPKPKRKRPRLLASWAAEALVHWPSNEDITAEAFAERTGHPLIHCVREITRAMTEGKIRRLNSVGGRATTVWERTKAEPDRAIGKAAATIAAMNPGTRFVARELAMPNATVSDAVRVARELGLIQPAGTEAPKRGIYRKV
jgi:hypothetical protein